MSMIPGGPLFLPYSHYVCLIYSTIQFIDTKGVIEELLHYKVTVSIFSFFSPELTSYFPYFY